MATHFISQDVASYLRENYNIDLSEDNNISTLHYNPHCCHARVWKSDPEYIPYAGGYENFQCMNPINSNGLCEIHKDKPLTLGKINEDPPKEPFIIDSEGNKIKCHWISDSEGMKKDEVFVREEEAIQNAYKEKKGRGRPPSKKILFSSIDWNELVSENKLNTLALPTIKEYLIKEKLSPYGKKDILIERIKEHITQSQ